MRLTVLADNNASFNFIAEWGLSIFIESGGRSILFDLGASDLFLRNAVKLDLDLMHPDYLVLSHGHYDHTWGLDFWLKQYLAATDKPDKQPVLVAHPLALHPKYRDNMTEFGALASETTLKRNLKTMFFKEPAYLTEKLLFLGEIKRRFDFENCRPLGKTLGPDGALVDDYLVDDSALVYKTKEGIAIITGCSHSGICNIVEYAREVCNEERVIDVIGGFHLLGLASDDRQLEGTLAYFNELKPVHIHPCHCTDLKAKIALARVTRVEEVSAGFAMEL
jgi:Metal-dependent hydrolases of the beta-lactamase superfamily II